MTSCRAGLHRDPLKFYLPCQHVKRASGMPLKPYHKLQKKEAAILDLRSNKGMHLNNQSSAKEEQCNGATKKCLPSSDNQPRKPLGTISQNTMCNTTAVSASNSFDTRSKSVPNATLCDDGGCSMDSCVLIKPGNTKEKIAFFASHHCSGNRNNSMKIKSTGDASGRAAKRRKKSVDLKRGKNLEKVHEVHKMCLFSESFPSAIENCSINVTDHDGILPCRPISVIEMVSFLEERASALLSDCVKPFSNSHTSKCAGPSKCGHPGVAWMALEACEAASGKEHSEKTELESVCVLEMVAKLESECLRQQNERESGGLSRSNSLRRHVGRMLLASGLQQNANLPTEPSTALDSDKELAASSMENNILQNVEDLCSVKSWENHASAKPQDPETLPPVEDCCVASVGLELVKETYLKLGLGDLAVTVDPCKFSISVCIKAVECVPKSFESPTLNVRAADKKVEASDSSTALKAASVLMNTLSQQEAGHKQDKALTGDPSPGKIFFQSGQNCSKRAHGPFSPDVKSGPQNLGRKPFDNTLCLQNSSMIAQYSLSISSLENVTQVLDSCSIKRQVSHDFLETRFKIQQLLEPQQYMAFLPHHILVKIFRYIPTRTLAALKCTSCYFKFIIEHYDIRPCDSLWVRDPRYKDDPCKQCKKKYAKGDVSLCLWHPKPYCQALPYGPGFWMCCHMSQKDSRGCKVGLHDNRWVPAFHSLNRTVCKKSESEFEED
ncbi:F-box only protein 34 isoform 1-T2 [Mantella aurantiaca]